MFRRLVKIVVALIFIVSGFVKAVDVKGFSFKLEEYFSPQVFNIAILESWVLPIAFFVVILELILGILLLLKISVKKVLLALIGLCVFFAFLTFYSAYFNVVTDCGCFGDAVKFTPWQSFWKDIVLLVLLLLLYFAYRDKAPTSFVRARGSVLFLGTIVSLWIMLHGIKHEPIIDFRDYKIGTDLKSERKKIEENPSEYKTFYTLEHQKTKEVIKVNQDDYINQNYWQNPDWIIQEDKTTSEVVKEGYTSEIVKFKIEDPYGNDITDSLIQAPRTILVFSYKPTEIDANLLEAVENKVSKHRKTVVYGVSTAQNTFKTLPNAMMDGTAIKTIARSNPFVLVLENGKITDKKSAKDYIY